MLVRREIPAVARRRAAAPDRAADRQARRADRAFRQATRDHEIRFAHEAALGFGREDRVDDWFERIAKLESFGRLPRIAFVARMSKVKIGFTSGHAWYQARRIVVTLPQPAPGWPAPLVKAEVIATLLHQVAHIATEWRVRRKEIGPTPTHGRLFWREVFRAVCCLTGRPIDFAPRIGSSEQQTRATHEIAQWLVEGGQ